MHLQQGLVPETLECINSLTKQDRINKEILLVINKNDELYKTFLDSIPASVNILVNKNPRLSEARTLWIKNAKGDIIVFKDYDAAADKNYLSNLIKNNEDENVAGVVGKILPTENPGYPEELYWIGGFTYKGFPEARCEVSNGHRCNMSIRREVFDKAGLFDVKLGRVGKKLVTAEETEFSIRILNSFPGSKIKYEPLRYCLSQGA
jgi:glycosyltransferase involved in cell wall biosynthesis